ncbi:malonate decarboxylase subunit epsilon [Mangrovibacter yixingensis]|uniref:malonate decarboxylase subunit epsilon n=1 Tax=Mangrovibacter yixingensis TaxID=1529639 RepID=UPI001CFA8467|nr:malonate decarboxylase subunit epsilon [Mangrovibacter yixingensis]
MKVMFTFPGQGTQYPGMLADCPQGAATDNIFAQTRSILGSEFDNLDTPAALKHTRAVQLCLLIAGVATARTLADAGVRPDLVCGLSIGAYPAAVVAGALAYEDAVRLVALRGTLMEEAWPSGYGLTAIMGLSLGQVEKLVDNQTTWVANINAETQIVIAGSTQAMAHVAQQAMAQGASRAKQLDVSVPSHCPLLDKPAEKLAQAMESVTVSRPQCTWISGSTARAVWQGPAIANDLAFNMARTVNWRDAMVAAMERDARLFIEMQPGSTLTGLTRQAVSQGECVAFATTPLATIQRLAQRVKGE